MGEGCDGLVAALPCIFLVGFLRVTQDSATALLCSMLKVGKGQTVGVRA